jgi:hypothetical protein
MDEDTHRGQLISRVESVMPFKVEHKPYTDLRHINIEVQKAYNHIVTDFRYMLSRFTSEENRTYIMTDFKRQPGVDFLISEFICVMGSVTLYAKDYAFYISLETDNDMHEIIGDMNFRQMLRACFRATNFECTCYDLEHNISFSLDMLDHYGYFQRRIKDFSNPDALIDIEEPTF